MNRGEAVKCSEVCAGWWGVEDAGVLTSLEKGTGDGAGAGLGILCRSFSGNGRATAPGSGGKAEVRTLLPSVLVTKESGE